MYGVILHKYYLQKKRSQHVSIIIKSETSATVRNLAHSSKQCVLTYRSLCEPSISKSTKVWRQSRSVPTQSAPNYTTGQEAPGYVRCYVALCVICIVLCYDDDKTMTMTCSPNLTSTFLI